MNLLADIVAPTVINVIPEMEGVTTALVLFIFACVAMPHLVKYKAQYYAAFSFVLLIILLHTLNLMLGRESAGFQVFAGVMTGLLQLGAIVLLFMSCGGVTLRQLAGDMVDAYEVIRRGETEKTIIVPLTGEQPKPRQQPSASSAPGAAPGGDAPPVEKIDLPGTAGWPKKSDDDNSSIPLE